MGRAVTAITSSMTWPGPADLGIAVAGSMIAFDWRRDQSVGPPGRHAVPTWEEWTEDVTAMLEAAESHQHGDLRRPRRWSDRDDVRQHAPWIAAGGADLGLPRAPPGRRRLPDWSLPEDLARLVDATERLWGTEDLTRLVNPALASDVLFVRENARRLRAAATPRTAAAQYNYLLRQDARSALPLIQAPTLVLHMSHNPIIPLEHGRYLAKHIPGSKFVEIPGRGIMFDDGGSGRVLVELSSSSPVAASRD